jgi:hypothetical protein
VNLKLSSITRYAIGSAPFVGIPILGVGVLVFRRDHLKAAISTGPTRIVYNSDTKTLTFRSRRSEWKLNDLLGQQKFSRYEIQEQLNAWARSRRSGALKRKATAALGKAGVYVRRLREAIAKLERQRVKIYLQQPRHPLMHERMAEAGDYSRNAAKRWADEKTIRKSLAKVAGQKLLHGEPKTWADFYRAVETVTGRPVSESATFARVRARKRLRHGLPDHPDREDYLKYLPRYLFLSEKPWDHQAYDPYKKDTYGEQLNTMERHAKARMEYCAALRERKALDSQIDAHRVEIVSVTAEARA